MSKIFVFTLARLCEKKCKGKVCPVTSIQGSALVDLRVVVLNRRVSCIAWQVGWRVLRSYGGLFMWPGTAALWYGWILQYTYYFFLSSFVLSAEGYWIFEGSWGYWHRILAPMFSCARFVSRVGKGSLILTTGNKLLNLPS